MKRTLGQTRDRGVAGVLLGMLALMMAVAAEMTGVFSGLDDVLRSSYVSRAGEFASRMDVRGFVGMGLAGVWCAGMTMMVFFCHGMTQRVVLGVTALVLAAGLSPTFAAWGIYWAPFPLLLGASWAWGSALVYVLGHPRREELSNVIQMTAGKKARVPQRKQS